MTVLEKLTEGIASIDQIASHLGLPSRGAKRDKVWHLISSMLRDGTISGRRAGYHLTPVGRDALEALRGGHEVTIRPQTSVRVFA